jgi:hypothetical protein
MRSSQLTEWGVRAKNQTSKCDAMNFVIIARMSRVLFVVLAAAALFLPATAHAQDVSATPLAINFSGRGNVLELDFPENAPDLPFFIVWNSADGSQYNAMARARGGRHCYELRNRADWVGNVQAVGITVPNVPGRIKKPTFSDEIDMFFEPEPIAPTTVNFLLGHRLFTWPLNAFLLLILFLSALFFAKLKRMPAVPSLALSFLVSWVVMDLRTVYDHAVTVNKMETYKPGLFPLTGLNVFADRASGMIGRETWGHDLEGIFGTFVTYRLAEHRFMPAGSSKPPAFWITRNPADGQVVWQYANYFLLKKNRP